MDNEQGAVGCSGSRTADMVRRVIKTGSVETIVGPHGFGELRAGWRVVVAGLAGVAFGLPGLPFYTVGVFASFFAAEFGWSFASIFLGLSFVTGAMLAVGPLAGMLIDRWGARLVSACSLVGLGVSYMTLAAADGSLSRYYLSWALISVFGIGATPAAFTRMVNGAFERRRGLALGLILSGSGLFAFVVKALGFFLIGAIGWRATILVIGTMPVLIAAPLVLWGFSRTQAAANRATLSTEAPEGLPVRDAVKSRAFWVLAAAFIPMSLAGAAPLPNLEMMLKWQGLAPPQVAHVASLIGFAIVAGRLGGGPLLDRFWAPGIGAGLLILGTNAWLLLALAPGHVMAATLFALLLGLVAGVELDLMAYLVARYLGMRSYATLYSALYGVFAVGAGFGPSLYAHVFDLTGSYLLVVNACALMLAAGAIILLLLGPYPTRLNQRRG